MFLAMGRQSLSRGKKGEGPAALPSLIHEEAASGDIVVFLGAGDITAWAYALPAQLEALRS